MATLYRLHPMQWMRDHNHLIEVLASSIIAKIPNLSVVEDTIDKLNFVMDGEDYYMNECELLLDLGDRIIAVSFLDNASKLAQLVQDRNNPLDLFIYSQPDNAWPSIADRSVRGVYVTMDPFINLDAFYQLRASRSSFYDKIVFRGNVTGVGRGSVPFLIGNDAFVGPDGKNSKEYFEDIIKYKVGLSLPGVGELCYRDIEYMAIGLPMLRFEYEFDLNPPLIPNYHYISIPRPDNMSWVVEREGSLAMADAYLARFNEVRYDTDFLTAVSENANQYYKDNYSITTRVPRILSLMGL